MNAQRIYAPLHVLAHHLTRHVRAWQRFVAEQPLLRWFILHTLALCFLLFSEIEIGQPSQIIAYLLFIPLKIVSDILSIIYMIGGICSLFIGVWLTFETIMEKRSKRLGKRAAKFSLKQFVKDILK